VKQHNARHHPRPSATYMRGSVMGRRVHAVVMPLVIEATFAGYLFREIPVGQKLNVIIPPCRVLFSPLPEIGVVRLRRLE
jgi:hypothetical protein